TCCRTEREAARRGDRKNSRATGVATPVARRLRPEETRAGLLEPSLTSRGAGQTIAASMHDPSTDEAVEGVPRWPPRGLMPRARTRSPAEKTCSAGGVAWVETGGGSRRGDDVNTPGDVAEGRGVYRSLRESVNDFGDASCVDRSLGSAGGAWSGWGDRPRATSRASRSLRSADGLLDGMDLMDATDREGEALHLMRGAGVGYRRGASAGHITGVSLAPLGGRSLGRNGPHGRDGPGRRSAAPDAGGWL
ncbi:MAG: hypothetical protein RLZZ565_1302, partial [Planctomycetota bacterium]